MYAGADEEDGGSREGGHLLGRAVRENRTGLGQIITWQLGGQYSRGVCGAKTFIISRIAAFDYRKGQNPPPRQRLIRPIPTPGQQHHPGIVRTGG